ncbi:MAG: alpha-mannosidase [Alphaproteobacteria bacterium]|nr:alpha-mannosidase [Alphaproteobacteria bacterium]
MEEFYINPLAKKHDLQSDSLRQEAKLLRLCEDLEAKILTSVDGEINWHYRIVDPTEAEALAADWRQWEEFTQKTVWGRKQGHTWFSAEVTVPQDAAGKVFLLHFTSQWQDRLGSTDPQCLVYINGKIAQALDGNHTELVIARNAVAGEKYTVTINAFTFFDRPLVGFKVDFFTRFERVEQLYYDLQIPLDVAILLPQHDGRRHAILNIIERSLRALDRRGGVTENFEASLKAAELIAGEIYQLQDTESKPTITAIGHTHIDVAWLWRVLHTRDKTGRSFATALSLMDEYPEFVFMYNQAVLLDFLKDDYPEIWQKVKKKVASGQFEIEGAMWVEPDVNIISGESLVRQFMFGRRFHQQQFGVTPKVAWLPDTFGYSANLPQIMQKSGLEYFVTSKLSWNDSDRLPYDTFFWRGIDGTTTKAQLITTQDFTSEQTFTTYNSVLSASEVMGAWKRYEPKALNDEVLICYGYGDGGGGPTRRMIESGRRFERGIPGAPLVKFEGIAPFLQRLGARMDENIENFPVWNGELYLQFHRGTLTSVAKNKTNNRRAERAMRELEYLSVMAMVFDAETKYPNEKINELWKVILINQFHDILPGTSIAEVYDDSDVEYAVLFSALEGKQGLHHEMVNKIAKPCVGILNLFNFTSQIRDGELVKIASDVGDAKALAMNGIAHVMQKSVRANGEVCFIAPVGRIPSLGWASAQLLATPTVEPETSLSVSFDHMENEVLRVEIDENGEISSIFDKVAQRELIEVGKTANALVIYEDKPLNWSAWDIDRSFVEQSWPLSGVATRIEVVETGPYRAAIRIEKTYENSKIVQIVSLRHNERQIEFDTYVDWQERESLLKTSFPFDLNTTGLRSEIQFGHVKRATHSNTSWDQAQFEASMHRWVDMSEADFGVALLNDCKYGYDAVEQTVRLTLLRGSIFPDAHADIGEHNFRYALKLHGGIADMEQVVRAAERFNNPIKVFGDAKKLANEEAQTEESFSFASVDADNVTIETLKKAEDSDDLILRVFEHANKRVAVNIGFGLPVENVVLVNLMEEGAEPILVENNIIGLKLRPFEIVTLRIKLK